MSAEQWRWWPEALGLCLLLLPLAPALPTTGSRPDVTDQNNFHATTSSPQQLQCEPEERRCWSHGQLPLSGSCWTPLVRGPCGEGEWVVLDLESAVTPAASSWPRLGSRLRATCASRQCPKGRVPLEGRCLSESEASAALCGGRAVHLDPKGLPRCGAFPGWMSALAELTLCSEPPVYTTGVVYTTAVAVGGVRCAQRDNGDCGKNVEGPATNAVVIEPEDF